MATADSLLLQRASDWARRFAASRSGLAYAVAVGGPGLVLGAALALAAPPATLPLMLAPPVFAASALRGAGPGLLATTFGAAGLSFAPGGGFSAEALLLFLALGLAAAVCGEWALRTQRRGEQAIRVLTEREAQLRLIFDAAPDAMIVIDERGIIQSYSAAAQRMFGWSAAEVLGRDVAMLMPSPFRHEHGGYLQRYLETGEKRIIGIGRIVAGERKDGASFPMELNVGEVRAGQSRLFTGFVRDLTERQKTQARLQELQAELVHISRLSAMGEMASALAHELNQPLSAIANYLSGARRLLEQESREDRRALDAIAKATEQTLRAGDIIRRLRDFLARGESERTVEPLPKLVQEACTLALVGAKEYGVRVQYRLDPRADRVLADRVQIQQVILNLVRNALDAMRDWEGRRELLVSTEPVEEGMAMVSVADTGPGLDPDAAARLFQPFVTTKAQGMGVGLSISKTIVEAHGGRIWTEPNPNGGAIFRFTAPLARTQEEGETR